MNNDWSKNLMPADYSKGWSGEFFHPNSPRGGAGPGNSSIPGPLGVYNEPGSDIAHYLSPVGRNYIPNNKNAVASSTFGVADIPNVMRDKLGWPKSADIMKKWLNARKNIMTDTQKSGDAAANAYPQAYREASIFTMDWITNFTRGGAALTNLIANLQATNAIRTLQGIIGKRANLKDLKMLSIKNVADPVELHSNWQFQYEKVGYDHHDSLDDLYGSLGKFALYAALLEGEVTRKNENAPSFLRVTKVGIYMRDTFDFIGPQYLGHWNSQGMGLNPSALGVARLNMEWYLPAYIPGLGWAKPFNNSDFRRYREDNGKGGDLLVISDVIEVPVNFTIQFSNLA